MRRFLLVGTIARRRVRTNHPTATSTPMINAATEAWEAPSAQSLPRKYNPINSAIVSTIPPMNSHSGNGALCFLGCLGLG
ncbi:hypothetical protein KDK_74940 [Dictyobacter kobayashii]|uniref:Uncharacterized protein n=1 Tax=Dictyobacter kobayashii TaxID=2014872 RepID=A0A402AXB2_9CHLR|nr:hypothetical protein KDK_74940 [Dictyobacter kobayashii]